MLCERFLDRDVRVKVVNCSCGELWKVVVRWKKCGKSAFYGSVGVASEISVVPRHKSLFHHR
jgi:hypothetical protein